MSSQFRFSPATNITTNGHTTQSISRILIKEGDFNIFQFFFSFICQGVNVIGIGTNIINIVCFTHQGFNDPINVSLMGLAISDLLSLVTLLWSSITPVISNADLPFDPVETQYIISGIPHTTFARITGWITALITLERCLCITVPLKVKDIITSGRVTAVLTIVFMVNIAGIIPIYFVTRLGFKWSPLRNKTIVRIVFKRNREVAEKVSFMFNNGFLSFTSFLIIIISTAILVIKLHKKSKWRQTTTTKVQAGTLSNRNENVAKMVVIISIVFIICFIPITIAFLAMASVPGLSIDGEHRYVLMVAACMGVLLEAINSSVNMFVYLHMSSKYREVFKKLFLRREREI